MKSPRRFLICGIFATLCLASSTGIAQKKPLDHDVYDVWNKINESTISPDGKWVMFSLGPEDSDPQLRLKTAEGELTRTFARGDSANFTDDSRFAVFMIRAHKDSVKQAKRDKKKPDQMPKDSLGLFDLSTKDFFAIPSVKSYGTPKNNGGWLAYHLEKALEEDPEEKSEEKAEGEKGAGEEKSQDKKKKRATGSDLVLRNLTTGVESRFQHALSYRFSEDGRWLVYTAANADSSADGISAIETATGQIKKIMQGKGDYKHFAIDEAGEQIAFLSNRDSVRAEQPAFTLYYWQTDSQRLSVLASEGSEGVPPGWWVSENREPGFSKDGSRVLFGTTPRPEAEPEKEEPQDDEVVVDVWNWKDPLLQPMQLKQVKTERKRTYLAVADLRRNRIVQLATKEIPEVEIGNEDNAGIAMGTSTLPYRREISWDFPRYSDVYLIDVNTGGFELVAEKIQARARLSPMGNYLTWWSRADSAWFALDVKNPRRVNLTAQIPQPVYNELHDWAYPANPYGNAGWTQNDERFLVYDRYDIWATDPTGKQPPQDITEGHGRTNNLRLRYVRLDPEEQAIDSDSPILLSAFNLKTKAAGFYRDRVAGNEPPQQLLLAERSFSSPKKARKAEKLLFTRSSFVEFPDLWVSDPDFGGVQRVSHANPRQSEYFWGTAELMTWASLDGTPLQGILYKPENFDATSKYPLMVYFYERNSDNLHKHFTPEAHRSIINITFYASRGYVVFVPDIPYKVGYPGESALHAVVPGVTQLIKQGFVDEANIGVQGHSWGGYQIAYMVTRTNIFKAAEAGAPVSNMTSAYGGIRWGTGMSRMFQYERTQSRIGGSLWEYPMRYLENSPIFRADKIQTPLLIMHNDHDTAVPWYQGIELFVALRRLGKPAWMINYNDEPHWPTKFQNKKDWQIRMQQFFDHYLKGAPAPVWLEYGVPAVKKGKTLGLEPVTVGTNGKR